LRKYHLIGVSICAVFLLVLGSLTNVIGYETIQSSTKTAIKEEVDQKELLFQTILDIANNKEIQKIILSSEIRRDGFFTSGVGLTRFTSQFLTKDSLNRMYLVGLVVSKTISKTKLHSTFGQNQLRNQGIQKEITAVIGKNATLNREITHLSESKCDCENKTGISPWNFPIICAFLYAIILAIESMPWPWPPSTIILTIGLIGKILGCDWVGN
jgi:hypothetical protein